MLGTLRKGAHTFFAKMLMGLLVASFAVWGIGDITRNAGGPAEVATVGEEAISAAEFQMEMQKLRRSFGENFTPELVQSLNLYTMKLQEMINRLLIRQEVERLKIDVSDDDLLKAITQDPSFHNANGEFDKPLFLKTLQQWGVNEKTYLESVRTEMAVKVLLSAFSHYSLVPTGLARHVYEATHEKRKTEIVVLRHAPGVTAAPDTEALTRYYESNKARYTAPEYRAFSYAALKPEDVMKQVSISRQELFSAYTQRTAEFIVPEQRDVDQLLYSERNDAQEAYAMLRKGASVEETVAQIPPKSGKAMRLGQKSRDSMPAGGKEVFALDKGEYTPPVESPFGWHIFIVRAIVPESTAPFDEVKEALKNEIIGQRANTMLSEMLEQFEDELSAGNPLKEAAETVGLSFETRDPVDRAGQSADHSQVFDPKDDAEILDAAFSLQTGERSDLVALPDGGYVTVHLDSVIPARERTFEEVRGQVAADADAMLEHEALAEYAKKTAALLAAATSESAMNKALASVEGATRLTLSVGRDAGAQEEAEGAKDVLSPMLRERIFRLSRPGEATDATPVPQGFAVAILKDVLLPPDPQTDEQGRKLFKAIKRSLREDYQNEILDQYLRELRKRYPVTLNEAALQSLTAEP